MSSTKLAVEKKLRHIKTSDIYVIAKEFLHEVKFINKGLAATVLFKNVTIDDKIRKKASAMFEGERVMDFSRMPFDDVSIMGDLEYFDEKSNEKSIRDGFILRYTRSKEEDNLIYITQYIKLGDGKTWIISNIKGYNTDDGNFDIVACDKRFKHFVDRGHENDEHVKSMALALLSMTALLSFEPVKIEQELTFSERKHVPSGMTGKYIEYTLDLSKPIKKRLWKSAPKGGSHNPPCEHTRRGHTRTYKSGKVVFVKGSVINKGSTSGKVEKDYSLT